MYVYIHLLYPFLCQWTFRLFQVLTIVNSAAVGTGVHVSFQIRVFPGCMSRSGIAGSYGNSVFSFLRSLFSVLYSGYANLHSHQQTHVLLKSFVVSITHYFYFPLGIMWTLCSQLQSHAYAKKRWTVVSILQHDSYTANVPVPNIEPCME